MTHIKQTPFDIPDIPVYLYFHNESDTYTLIEPICEAMGAKSFEVLSDLIELDMFKDAVCQFKFQLPTDPKPRYYTCLPSMFLMAFVMSFRFNECYNLSAEDFTQFKISCHLQVDRKYVHTTKMEYITDTLYRLY
ncbi:hypothetical protein [Telluribacter humicola]|uniref:hypothetical protein n=1 Tax=Telluribacter humicola TaxID=1720261 RepID=UPI001A95AD98|nr:hypothetical protein [Telluribacter humicola]